MADYRQFLDDLSGRTGASVEESDYERLQNTNPEDVDRLMQAYESQYARRGASGQTGSGTDSSELTNQGYGSARGENQGEYQAAETGRGPGGFGGGMPSGGMGDYGQYFNQLFQPLQNQFQGYMDQLSQQRAADQARRQGYEDQVRSAIMGIMNQQPQTADQIALSPEARSYQRLGERSQQLLRAQNAERTGQVGTGGVQAGPGGPEMGGALGSAVETGSRDLAERTNAIQAQMMGRELQARRDQLMQALQLGAGLMTADQQRDLQRELTQIDASLRNTLGQGGLSLGLLGNLMQNQQFGQSLGAENDRYYSGLGAQMGYQQAMLNQLPFQYLFG